MLLLFLGSGSLSTVCHAFHSFSTRSSWGSIFSVSKSSPICNLPCLLFIIHYVSLQRYFYLSNCHLTLLFPYEQYLHHLLRIPKESLNRLDITSSHILLSRGVAASDIEPKRLTILPLTPLTPATTILEPQNYHIAGFGAPESIPPIQYILPASMVGESSNQTGKPSRGPTIAIADWSLSSQNIGQRSFMQRKTRRVRDKSSTFEDWSRIYGTVC